VSMGGIAFAQIVKEKSHLRYVILLDDKKNSLNSFTVF